MAINIKLKKTIVIVDPKPIDCGIQNIQTIAKQIKSGEIFFISFENNFFSSTAKYKIHHADISQNLVGIR